MKVISLGTGTKIFEADSEVRRRQIEYGKLFKELHLIVFTPNNEKFQNQKLGENVFLYPTKTKTRALYFLDFVRIVKGILKGANKKEFVLSTQDPFETGVVGIIVKFLYKLPLQIQLHTDFANKYFILHSLLNLIRFPVGLITLSFADSVRVVSERISKSVHSLSHNVLVLPIYTEAKHLSPTPPMKDHDKVNFLTVCRIEKEKDLETALKAFKLVLDTGLKADFTIVGDGSQRRILENLCKNLGISDKVKFVGWQNDLEKYYRSANIYVSTSLYEGYGMSIVEASSYGLPIIATDAGIATDFFKNGENALISEPKNRDAIFESMKKLGENIPLRTQMGDRAREAVQKKEITKEQYLAGYRKSIEDAVDYNNLGYGIFKKNMLLRYLVAGFIGAFTQIGSLYFFTDILGVWYIYSSLMAFCLALCVSFTLQKTWTFGENHTVGMQSQFMKYMLVALFGVLVNTGTMFVLVEIFGIWYILSQIIAGAFIASINFLAYKFFIFNKPQTT